MSSAEVRAVQPLLRVEQVTRRFGGLKALDGVSFRIPRGNVMGLVGPNGAGKTTLFNVLTGQLRPTSGEVWFGGRRVSTLAPQRRARLGLGRTFQIVKPFHSLTVAENVMVGAFMRERRRAPARRHADRVLAEVELDHRAEVRASELTLAERKRLEVARALATRPELLLLDEVMAGLNSTEVGLAIELIRRLNSDGLTVLLIEHNLKVVRALAQRVLVLDHGAPIAEGGPDEVLEDPAVVEAYLGRRKA